MTTPLLILYGSQTGNAQARLLALYSLSFPAAMFCVSWRSAGIP